MTKSIEQQIAESQAVEAAARRRTAALHLVGVAKAVELLSDPVLGELVEKLQALKPTVNPTSQERLGNILTALVSGPATLAQQVEQLTAASAEPAPAPEPIPTPEPAQT